MATYLLVNESSSSCWNSEKGTYEKKEAEKLGIFTNLYQVKNRVKEEVSKLRYVPPKEDYAIWTEKLNKDVVKVSIVELEEGEYCEDLAHFYAFVI